MKMMSKGFWYLRRNLFSAGSFSYRYNLLMSLIIPYFIHHRGCPHRCLFCNQVSIAGRNQHDSPDCADDLQQTIEMWLARSPGHDMVQVAFFGGSFTCIDEVLQKTLLEAAAPYITSGQVGSIRMSTRPDCLSAEMCDFLGAHGVKTVEIGAQSMHDQVLERALRGHTVADIEQSVRLLKSKQFETGVQLMVGLPGETTRSFLDGVKDVVKLAPDLVRIYPTLVLKQTELADVYQNSSWYPLSLDRAVSLAATARELFLDAGIRVIRMGLQPSNDLEEQLIAGPYHPAFGELVISRSWYRTIRRILVEAGRGKTVELTISDKDYSAVIGNKRKNMNRLENLANGAGLRVKLDRTIPRGSYRHAVS